jgi:hypothetical protein
MEEPDWFKSMKKPLDHLANLSSRYDVPILCAGNVFNHWFAEPALLSFALEYLPTMYAIPGKHDLPLHNIELIEKSGFWTLVLADKIIPVLSKEPLSIENNIILHGFPYGSEIIPLDQEDKVKNKYHVALATNDVFSIDMESQYKDDVKGYHSVVFGSDNKGFKTKVNDIPVINCGTLIRRRSNESEYIPQINLLCRSGNVLTHRVSTKNERLKKEEEDMEGVSRKSTGDMMDVINGLKENQIRCLDFIESVEFLMSKYSVNNDVRKMFLDALGRS